LRILHVIPSLAARDGGPAKAAVEMCRELLRHGEDVELYTTNVDGNGYLDVPLARPVAVRGVPVTYFPVLANNYFKISPQIALALKAAVRRFDVVHINSLYQFPSTVAAYYCCRYGVPYIIRPHGTLDPFLFGRHRPRKWLYEVLVERRNLRGAAAVHFTTAEELELASSLGLYFRGIVAPLGVDFEAAPDDWERLVNTTWPELAGKEVVLFLSRINFKKGLDVLAQAFGRIRRERKDVQLVIAGPDNEGYAAKVREWLKAEGCLSSVTFTGMVQGSLKAALLKQAQLFVLPSYTENFGIVVVEAMGAGLPVVISNKVNIWREVNDAGAGVVVNTDPAQVAEVILKLLADPTHGRELGERGYRLAHEHFSWESAGRQLMELYQQVVHPRPGPSTSA
jgi:glycosyltransferase involved in cell wall biosynthesis